MVGNWFFGMAWSVESVCTSTEAGELDVRCVAPSVCARLRVMVEDALLGCCDGGGGGGGGGEVGCGGVEVLVVVVDASTVGREGAEKRPTADGNQAGSREPAAAKSSGVLASCIRSVVGEFGCVFAALETAGLVPAGGLVGELVGELVAGAGA